jgi:hypothetical protein
VSDPVDKVRQVLEASPDVGAADFYDLDKPVKLKLRSGQPVPVARLICVVHVAVDAQDLGNQVAQVLGIEPPRKWRTSAVKRAMVLCARSGFVRVMPWGTIKPAGRKVPTIAEIAHDFRLPTPTPWVGPWVTGAWGG